MADTPENGSDVSEEQKREAVRQAVIRAKERQIKAKENAGAQDNAAPANDSSEADDSTGRDRRSGSAQRTRRRCCRGAGGGRRKGVLMNLLPDIPRPEMYGDRTRL